MLAEGFDVPGSTFLSSPVLVGLVLTSLCFVLPGSLFSQGVLLAGLVVPTGMRTYLILARRRADRKPISLLFSLGTFLTSAAVGVVFSLWLIVVIVISEILRDAFAGELLLIVPIGLACWLVISMNMPRTAHEARRGAIKPDWRRLLRIRFTVRRMVVGIAFIAFALWPVRAWWMRPTYTAIADYEAFVYCLCLYESQFMADRAEQCRQRASEGMAWDLDDEVSENLKICPYPSDGPGRSWLEQAEIWERAAERSRRAAQRHLEISEKYEPWFRPSGAQ